MFNFQKLDVWHDAIEFAEKVYEFSKSFPDAERFGLTNQMRRAAAAVSANVAEGSSRSSRVEFARFIEMATGSLFEVVSHATIARKQELLSEGNYDVLFAAAEKQSKMLSGLRRSLIHKKAHANG